MVKEISLFEHNEKAYEALSSSLENKPLAFVEHATGTGKSFILLKYLYTKMRDKRILFITRHYEMLEQLFNEQMSSLGLSKEDFYKFDTAIYPNILDMDMQEVIKNYDCIVWDEAHHCGATKWSTKVNELKELVKKTPGKVMIGTTATRIRYLDDYMDVSEKFFDGNVVSELPVTRAILQNLLPAPTIIMTGQSSLEQIEKLQKKLDKLPKTKEVKKYETYLDVLKKVVIDELYIGNVLKKYDVHQGEKYIVFCSDIKDLKRKMKDAEAWFKDIGPVKMYQAHSNQKRQTNIDQINSFSKKKDEISLMFAVDIFNEGFHIDGVDGILTFRKTKSPIVYWQQLGRALSFSARKNKIKLFDFANNTSDNKVVLEIYKEMLEEAKRLVKTNPENRKLYEEILCNFQIVDQTSSVIEALHEIETKIDQEFIIKDRIDLAIYTLEEYRTIYPNTDFNEELKNKTLDIEYIRAYNYICEVEDYLTTEQIDKLQSFNISFTSKINLDKNKRLELLGDNKTFKELETRKLNDFINQYVEFCNANNRRPTINDNEELYLQYRKYLKDLGKNKLNKLLSKVPFRLTLEETIILGNYPSREDINSYINTIKSKIDRKIPLDAVEVKVLKKIIHAIPSNDTKLLNYLNNYTDINYQIEEAIETIKKYKRGENILDTNDYKNALRTINRFALRITNKQFLILLQLGIKLPHKIDMTIDRRLKELNGFDSFYDKQQNEKNGAINSYIKFVQEHKRRPSIDNEKERKLKQEYEIQIYKTSRKKIQEVTSILLELNIPLTKEESILSKNKLSEEELETFISNIHDKLLNNEKVTKEELRLLRNIEQDGYYLKINITNFIKMITTINMIDEMISNYEFKGLNELQKKNLMRSIFLKSKFFTKYHIDKLRKLNIEIPNEIIEDLNIDQNYINRYEYEQKRQEQFFEEFIAYLKTNNRYPDNNSSLMQQYRIYLGNLSLNGIKGILKQIKTLGIELSIEEKILLKEQTREETITYYEMIRNKIKNNQELDSLEIKTFQTIDSFSLIDNSKNIIIPSRIRHTSDVENRIVQNIRQSIILNPYKPLDLDNNYSLSTHNKKRLKIYRTNILGNRVFTSIIKAMKESKEPLKMVIDNNTKELYESLSKSQDLDGDNIFLLNQIKGLDREYTIKQKQSEINDIITKYLEFIKRKNGLRPKSSSKDEEEKSLALKYESIKEMLDINDIQRIERTIKKQINEDEIKTFYPKLIEFITEHGRFPCGNSDDQNEVYLNMLYQNIGSKLTREQSNELKKLKKVYGRATILANMEFAKNKNTTK